MRSRRRRLMRSVLQKINNLQPFCAGVALAWPNGSGPPPNRPCAVGKCISTRSMCPTYHFLDANGRPPAQSAHPPTSMRKASARAAADNEFPQYGVGESEIRAGPLSIGRRIDCFGKIDTVLPARPPRRISKKENADGECQFPPSLTIFSRASSIYF